MVVKHHLKALYTGEGSDVKTARRRIR